MKNELEQKREKAFNDMLKSCPSLDDSLLETARLIFHIGFNEGMACAIAELKPFVDKLNVNG